MGADASESKESHGLLVLVTTKLVNRRLEKRGIGGFYAIKASILAFAFSTDASQILVALGPHMPFTITLPVLNQNLFRGHYRLLNRTCHLGDRRKLIIVLWSCVYLFVAFFMERGRHRRSVDGVECIHNQFLYFLLHF